jgi:excinuclease UvrABC nuclease subunit
METLAATDKLEFEQAALLRDQIKELQRMMGGNASTEEPVNYGKSRRGRR